MQCAVRVVGLFFVAAMVFVCGSIAGRPACASPLTDDADAESEYARIARRFSAQPRAVTEADLDRFVSQRPALSSKSISDALIWRGQLAFVDGDLDVAERSYRAALAHSHGNEHAHEGIGQRPLEHRGLGDIALRRGQLDEAEREYRAASSEALAPALRAELSSKISMVIVARFRGRCGWLAAAMYAACAAFFLVGAARTGGRKLRAPAETLYALPIFFILIISSRLADPRVTPALTYCGAGSLALITLSGLSPSHRRGLHVAVLLVGVAAVFYFSIERGHILDLLEQTFHTSLAD